MSLFKKKFSMDQIDSLHDHPLPGYQRLARLWFRLPKKKQNALRGDFEHIFGELSQIENDPIRHEHCANQLLTVLESKEDMFRVIDPTVKQISMYIPPEKGRR